HIVPLDAAPQGGLFLLHFHNGQLSVLTGLQKALPQNQIPTDLIFSNLHPFLQIAVQDMVLSADRMNMSDYRNKQLLTPHYSPVPINHSAEPDFHIKDHLADQSSPDQGQLFHMDYRHQAPGYFYN